MNIGRIQYIDTGHSFGGAERVTLALARAFHEGGSEVECLINPVADEFAGELGRRGIPARPVPEADQLSLIGRLAAEIRRFQPDILHIQRTWPLSDRYSAIAARRAGVPRLVTTEHVRFEECGLRDRLARRVLSRWDGAIVCVSEAVRESLLRFWKVSPSKLTVIPNGIDTGLFDGAGMADAKGRFFPDSCPFRIGAIGRLEEQKNFSCLLRAMPAILEREKGAALVIAGKGTLRAGLEDEARALGIEKSVTFAGSIPDAAPFLAELDLFVLPSLWEGLPLTILEAMAAGAPIVATAIDGTVEAVRHGEEGILVPPGDVESLAEACVTVMVDRAGGIERAGAAKLRVRDRFSQAGMIDRYRQVYLT